MQAKDIYNKYDKRVQEYMQNVIDCLKQDYGKIPTSWRVSLDLIADNYSIYLHALDIINKEELFKQDNYGRTFKHPAFGIMNQAQSQLKDLLKSFALTPLSSAKMKKLETDDIDAEKYIEDLIEYR
jgi:phage terminase small subunit